MKKLKVLFVFRHFSWTHFNFNPLYKSKHFDKYYCLCSLTLTEDECTLGLGMPVGIRLFAFRTALLASDDWEVSNSPLIWIGSMELRIRSTSLDWLSSCDWLSVGVLDIWLDSWSFWSLFLASPRWLIKSNMFSCCCWCWSGLLISSGRLFMRATIVGSMFSDIFYCFILILSLCVFEICFRLGLWFYNSIWL